MPLVIVVSENLLAWCGGIRATLPWDCAQLVTIFTKRAGQEHYDFDAWNLSLSIPSTAL